MRGGIAEIVLTLDEERQVGNVKWDTYKLYIKAVTYTTWAIAFTLLRESSAVRLRLISTDYSHRAAPWLG